MENIQQDIMVGEFIRSTDKQDNYMVGSELTKQVIKFIGAPKFVQLYDASAPPAPCNHLSADVVLNFYNQNQKTIKDWVDRIVSKEKRGTTEKEKLANILGFTTTAAEQLIAMLNHADIESPYDGQILVFLVDTIFGTVGGMFKSFSRDYGREGYKNMVSGLIKSEVDNYEMFVGGTPSTIRHGCNISGDICEFITNTLTPMAVIGDTNIFDVNALVAAAKEGGALHGVINNDDLMILNAIKENFIEI